MSESERITIYTDGACSGNPGPGGWGAILIFRQVEKELSGGEAMTTNNRMEMMAAIEGLKALKRPCTVDLFTDSQYVMQGITSWMRNWKRRGWKTADNKPVKNEDLWRALDEEASRHDVKWHWVKGHADDPINIRVDEIAVAAMQPFKAARKYGGASPTTLAPTSLKVTTSRRAKDDSLSNKPRKTRPAVGSGDA